MNEIVLKKNIKVENLIYEVRRVQVMLDSDVAYMFGYETKQINRQVARNINRFPENYCFKLTEDEYENLRCQNGTSSEKQYGGRRYLPYVFTEHGITMLASILKSEIAVAVSLKIVDAFVKMRKILSSNNYEKRLSNVESRMLDFKSKYENEWQELTVFERASKMHMAIINIHPFSDGNGRTARLIMNYELIKNNYPPVLINESQKLSYYAMLEEINGNTDYLNNPLVFGDIKLFNETLQQLSILTFKNMKKYFD